MKPRVRAVALALAAHQAALAQEAPVAAMASVEIVGSAPLAGLGIERRLLPYTVQSASSERMAAAHSDNLADFMVRNLNGINVNEIAGSPFQNDITFRGFRASPVLGSAQGISVYLDGVRVNEPFGDVVNWDMLPESALGNVLLVPGSNPVYGLNTLGGALALASKSGLSHPGTQVELTGGSGGRKRVDFARGGGSAQGWHSFIGATLFEETGWRAHSQGALGNVFVKLGRGAWSVSLVGGRSRLRGNGLLPDALYNDDRRGAYTFPDQTRNRLLQLALNICTADLTALAYARDSRRDAINGDAEEDGGGVLNTSSTSQHSQGASLLWSRRSSGHHLDIGASVDRSSVAYAQFAQAASVSAEREVLPDFGVVNNPGSSVTGSMRAVGVYVADTWALAPHTHVTASARFNRAQVNNTLTTSRGIGPAERFTYASFNPALGIAHQMGPGVTLFANLAQGNRVPTVIELGCADPAQPCQLPVGLQSDPYLKQVIARTIEAGVRTGSISLSVYRAVNRNDILFLSAGSSHLGYFANFERTRHQGADASAKAAFGALSLRASYSYLDAIYDAPGVLFAGTRSVQVQPGTPIAGLPAHTFKLGVDWQAAAGFILGADAQAISAMSVQGNEDGLLAGPRVRGHVVLNLRASWEPAPHWELYARVNNVSNSRYETFGALARNLFARDGDEATTRFVAPGAPRAMAFGVRYRY